MLRFLKFRPQNPFFATSGRNSQSCLFCQKIDTHGISRMLNFIPTLVFWISNPKSIFGETWAKENKVVSFVWKLAHTVSREYRLLFQHQFSDIRNLSLENADFYSDISFLIFQTKSFFFGKFESKKSNSLLSLEPETQSILRMWLQGYQEKFESEDRNE